MKFRRKLLNNISSHSCPKYKKLNHFSVHFPAPSSRLRARPVFIFQLSHTYVPLQPHCAYECVLCVALMPRCNIHDTSTGRYAQTARQPASQPDRQTQKKRERQPHTGIYTPSLTQTHNITHTRTRTHTHAHTPSAPNQPVGVAQAAMSEFQALLARIMIIVIMRER